MLKHFEEFRKYVLITGFRNIKIKNIPEFFYLIRKEITDVEFQFFDAGLIATWQHLYFAAFHALKSFNSKENISRSLPMETMLYASGQRQIRKAVEKFGIKPTSLHIAIVLISVKPANTLEALKAISKHLNRNSDETVLDLSNRKKKNIQKAFAISDIMLETMKRDGEPLGKVLINLVIEKMAILATTC